MQSNIWSRTIFVTFIRYTIKLYAKSCLWHIQEEDIDPMFKMPVGYDLFSDSIYTYLSRIFIIIEENPIDFVKNLF